MSQPIDGQAGEKLAIMERLYSILVDDAVERGIMREEFYFLSDEVLGIFKRMQGYDSATHFPGSRIEQAYLILAEPEWNLRHAVAEANGFTLSNQPLLPGGMALTFDDDDPNGGVIVLQNYQPRSVVSGHPTKSNFDE